MNDNWKSDLRLRMESVGTEVPDSVRVAVMEAVGRKERRRKAFFILAPALSAAAAIALVVMMPSHDKENPYVAETVEKTEVPAFQGSAPAVSSDNGLSAEHVSGSEAEVTENSYHAIQDGIRTLAEALPEQNAGTITDIGTNTDTGNGTEILPAQEGVARPGQEVLQERKVEEDDKAKVQENIYLDEGKSRTVRRFRPQVGLLASASARSERVSSGYGIDQRFLTKGYVGGYAYDAADPQTNGLFPAMLLLSSNRKTETRSHHHLPVNIGVTASLPVWRKLSVETGLMVSFLNSEFSSGDESEYYVSEQKMTYLGVPLNIRYSFLDHRRIEVYASAGGVMRIPVSYSRHTDSFVGGRKVLGNDDPDIDYKHLQWSAVFASGVQLNITKAVGIYAEPGFAWHFRSDSPVSNVYSDRPADFNLNVGLRFSL